MQDKKALMLLQQYLTDMHHNFLAQQQRMFSYFLKTEKQLLTEYNKLTKHNNQTNKENNNPIIFNYDDLIIHATGNAKQIFGENFNIIDTYQKRVRLPAPPFLLVNRVVVLKGEPQSLTAGTIITETDLKDDTWYLHEKHLPFGLMLEGAQGHLLLISWLGWDLLHQGKKVYRMLGGNFNLVGRVPICGDTLRYVIRVAPPSNENVNLIKMEYDCYIEDTLCLTVRDIQVGFFSEEELQASKGIIWDPDKLIYHAKMPLAVPKVKCTRTHFSQEDIHAFARGDLYSAFGKGFELAQTHIHSPRIPGGRLQIINAIDRFDANGGPWQRGYIRSLQYIKLDDWFFASHFIRDPVMPGLLSIEAFLQTMAFYLTALGFTLDKDGWRFEIVPHNKCSFSARGQVTPETEGVFYEIFVEEMVEEPLPTIFASVLASTFAGKKIYLLRHLGLRLVPDAPLSRHQELIKNESKPAVNIDHIKLDNRSFLEFAIGQPSKAFGKEYQPYDEGKKMPRTPAPPFQFMSRVTALEGKKGAFKENMKVEIEYDIPSDAWYFKENNVRFMPFCVCIEAMLQAAGWLSIYAGSILKTHEERFIRNLDGSSKVFKLLAPHAGTVTTEVQLENIASIGNIIIETFKINCFSGTELICYTVSSFGFFGQEALLQQVGLPIIEAQKAILLMPSPVRIDLTKNNSVTKKGNLTLAHDRLLMIDCITGFWREAGAAQLGILRAEKKITPSDWFFKAHFYQDPVQPGSLGLEGMLQLLEFYLMQLTGWEHFQNPSFEAPALNTVIEWKYRGQVLPQPQNIIYVMEITSLAKSENEWLASAEASLWVQDKKIYQVLLSVRLIDVEKNI